MIIDTHAHIYFDELVKEIEKILDRAYKAGIEKIILPSIDIRTSETAIRLSQKYDMLYPAIGIHPSEVKESKDSRLYEVETLLKENKVVASGEIGLDYYWDQTFNEKQKLFFETQLLLAQKQNLPVIIHTRNSIHDALDILLKENFKSLKSQFHCFSGSEEDLDRIIMRDNIFISFCGNITYKNYKANNIVNRVPLNRMVFETDSPFLSPVPHRGKKNEPSYIINTISKISEIKNVSFDKIIKCGYENTIKLFDKLI